MLPVSSEPLGFADALTATVRQAMLPSRHEAHVQTLLVFLYDQLPPTQKEGQSHSAKYLGVRNSALPVRLGKRMLTSQETVVRMICGLFCMCIPLYSYVLAVAQPQAPHKSQQDTIFFFGPSRLSGNSRKISLIHSHCFSSSSNMRK